MDMVDKLIGTITSTILGEQGTRGEWERENRYKSFAPEREGCHVKWYIDAKDYFYAVSEALMSAKEEIFIEDLWLTPELYLRRPPSKNEEYRLDRILKKKAEEGVRIYVVVYKEVPQTATYASKHSKTTLQNLDKNILVQRHPDHGSLGGLLWTHHEKIVVIDRHTSFIGGLDLCFGRYDTSAHQLADFHDHSKHYSIWPGQDYSNPRIQDFIEVENWAKTLVDKKQIARMPWHDIAVGFVGRPTNDIARHFIQRWNFVKKAKAENRSLYPLLIAKSDEQRDREDPPRVRSYQYSSGEISCHPDKGSCKVQIVRSAAKWSHGLDETEHSIQNAYIKIIEEAKHFVYIENQYFITATEEDPDRPVKNLIGKAIVDRITRAHENNEQFRIIVSVPLFVAYQGDIDSNEGASVRVILHHQHESICRGEKSIFKTLEKRGVTNPEKYLEFYSLRTYDKIKPLVVKRRLGVLKDEVDSILGKEPKVVDPDAETYVTEELYIHSKLLIADDRIVICGSANVNDRSQTGEGDSEIAAIIEDKDYINSKMAGKDWKAGKFAATLRRHLFKEHLGLLNESDHEKITTLCSPPPLPADEQELSKEDRLVLDPASDEFYYNVWKNTATVNTEVFQKVFHCVPDNTVTTWDEYKKFIPDRLKIPSGHIYDEKLTMEEVEAELSKVKGHLVYYPLDFMKKEKLTILESVIPGEIYKAVV